jgi:O-antigen ligase
MTPRLENKIFWPALAAISIVLIAANWSRLVLPPNIKCLFAYLAFAGASVLWAFKPELSFSRYVLQVMIVTSIVLPVLLANPATDMMRGLFLCFAFACFLNIPIVLTQEPIIFQKLIIGYPGYFSFKGVLGECAAIAFLLSLRELLYFGWRRALGIIVMVVAIWLMLVSLSKGSLGLAIVAPSLAGLALIIGKKMRISPAIVLLPIPVCYAVLSFIVSNLIQRISWHLYKNYTLSDRTVIWDFANFEIARQPLFGWGYQSFWLVGLDGPSIIDAPGWVKNMPSAHNGYLDTQLEMGYVGLAFLITFIIATLIAIGRVGSREPARAWLLLTLALYIILTNLLETTWARGMEPLWLLFLIIAADAGRYTQPFQRGVGEPIHQGPIIAGRRPGLARGWRSDKLAQFQNRHT